METKDSREAAEKVILRNQFVAIPVALVLFFILTIISILVFESDMIRILRTVAPVAGLPQVFVGLSSIKNKVSIFRTRGGRERVIGKQAVVLGFVLIFAYLMELLILYSPILPLFMNSPSS